MPGKLREVKRVRYAAGGILAVAAFLLVMMCMPQTGAIYSHDTQSYEYAASTLIESGDLKYFGYDTPIIQWPPFYIVMLAFLNLTGLDTANGASWLNAVLIAYMIYASAVFLFDILKVKWMAVPAAVMMAVSVPMLYISGYAWSETLFIFLSVVAAVFLLQYIIKKKNTWFYFSAVLSSLCWLTRYIGIVHVAVAALTLLIGVKPFWEKVKKTAVFLLISCAPMALWVYRNYKLSGTFTGGRQPGQFTLAENAELTAEVLKSWFYGWEPLFAYIAAGFYIFLVILAIIFKKNRKSKKEAGKGVSLLFFFLYIAAYTGVLFATTTTTALDPISSRLWAPVYPHIIFVLVLLLDILIQNIKMQRIVKWFAAGFAVFALIALINPAAWVLLEGIERKEALLGTKESAEIKKAPILKVANDYLQPSKDTLVISNQASIVAMHTDLKCYYPPKKEGIEIYTFSRYKEKMEDFRDIYLVWYGDPQSQDFMDIPEFRKNYELEVIADEGICFILKIKHGS
jgi:hypothetical protein